MNWRSVFLSYNHRDRNLATKLYEFLTSLGVDVWFDQVNSDPSIDDGELRSMLYTEVSKRDLVLLISTKNSIMKSYWVEQEINNLGFSNEEGWERRLILIVFSSESEGSQIVDFIDGNAALKRFFMCDLVSINEMEHASEWGLQMFLNADIPLRKKQSF